MRSTSPRPRPFVCPPFPPILGAIGRALDDPISEGEEIRLALRSDEGLTVSLLRYANSAWLARRRRVETINEALTVVGLAGLRSLVLAEFLGAFFVQAGPVEEFLWEHAFASALAIALQRPSAGRETEELYLCGLLHNIGKAILNAENPKGYAEVIRRIKEHGEDFCDAERSVFGTIHSNAGAVALEEMPLPRIVKDTILYHHAPDHAPAAIAYPSRKVLIADLIAYRVSPAWRALCAVEPPWLADRIAANPPSPFFEDIVARELRRMRSSLRLQPVVATPAKSTETRALGRGARAGGKGDEVR